MKGDTLPRTWWQEFRRDSYPIQEIVPLWKGFVCRDYMRNQVRVAPLGFNLLFQVCYTVFWLLRNGRIELIDFVTYQQELRDADRRRRKSNLSNAAKGNVDLRTVYGNSFRYGKRKVKASNDQKA